MSKGRNAEALEAFRFIYALNTRKPRSAFPVSDWRRHLPSDSKTNNRSFGDTPSILPQIKELASEVTTKAKPANAAADDANDADGNVKKTETEQKDVADVEAAERPKSSLRSGLAQLRPLFVKPYLRLSLYVYLLNFCCLLG